MKSLLITLLDNLGDVIMSSGAIRLLRESYPDARIDVLVRPETADVMRNNPDVTEVIVYPYKSKKFFYKLRDTVERVREKNYEVSLSLDRRSRAAWVTFLARIPKRLGTHILFRGCKPALWTHFLYTQIIPMSENDCYIVVEMFQIAIRRAFDISGKKPVRALPVLPECAERAERILAGVTRPIIGLSVRANFPLKTWPMVNFAELMIRLKRKLGAFLYITGAPSDREYAENLLETCPEGTAINLAGKTSVMDTVALAAKSDLFISLDTGTVHVVGHSGVPHSICIFGCTCPTILAGALPPTTSIMWTGEKCCPCDKRPEECPEHQCMAKITVDDVYNEAMALLHIPAGAELVSA